MFKPFLLISCIALFLQAGYAARTLSNPQAFDPKKCVQSVTNAAVCLTDLWTNFGKPSAACCKALGELEDTCIPSLFPMNPFMASFLKGICSGATGGGGSGGLPFPPFPFPLPGVGGGSGGGLPFPFPFPFPFPIPGIGGGSSGGLPFPFPFPLPGVGGGSSGGSPFPFPFPGVGSGSSAPPPKA